MARVATVSFYIEVVYLPQNPAAIWVVL